ncbi:MAG TPA: hypothetical protein VFY83_02935, partial [Anaerolineales bacterium]|nr:hypothetical protein [Anaerolineales bacterium]
MDKIKPQIGPVNRNEVLLKENGAWLHFSNPHRLIAADNLQDVLPALREIEGLVQANNWWAAGFLSYEAASAFDPAFQTHNQSRFPYLWFGLYPAPRLVQLPKPRGTKEILDWQPTICPETYNSAIAQIKDHIANGRTY